MKKLQLLAPPTYWRMPEKTRNKKYEGCGPGHLGNYFVPDTVWGLRITEACRIHDHEYEIGETMRDKRKADLHLYRNIVVLIYQGNTKDKDILRSRLKRAHMYYWFVKTFGRSAFYHNKEEF